MFDKFSAYARKSLFFARYEASHSGDRSIDTQHIILGVVRDGSPIARAIFSEFGIATDGIQAELGKRVLPDDAVTSSAELPLSSNGMKALAYASHEAESLGHPVVGPEHLLLGVSRVEKGASELERVGIDIERLREFVKLRYSEFALLWQHPTDTPVVISDTLCEWIDLIRASIHEKSGTLVDRGVVVNALLGVLATAIIGLANVSTLQELIDNVTNLLTRNGDA